MVGKRTRFKPHEDPGPGVLRTTDDTAWRVSVGPRKQPLLAGFADKRHGGRAAALELANAASKLFHRELGLPFTKRYTPYSTPKKGGLPRGICVVEKGWMVTIFPVPRKRKRLFVHRNKGIQAAIDLREQWFRKVYHLPKSAEMAGGRVKVRAARGEALRVRRRALLKKLTPLAQPRG